MTVLLTYGMLWVKNFLSEPAKTPIDNNPNSLSDQQLKSVEELERQAMEEKVLDRRSFLLSSSNNSFFSSLFSNDNLNTPKTIHGRVYYVTFDQELKPILKPLAEQAKKWEDLTKEEKDKIAEECWKKRPNCISIHFINEFIKVSTFSNFMFNCDPSQLQHADIKQYGCYMSAKQHYSYSPGGTRKHRSGTRTIRSASKVSFSYKFLGGQEIQEQGDKCETQARKTQPIMQEFLRRINLQLQDEKKFVTVFANTLKNPCPPSASQILSSSRIYYSN